MSKFLIVYRNSTGALLHGPEEFAENQGVKASKMRLAYETKYRLDPDVEVVTLGAESITALKKTHARYFYNLGELANSKAQ